MAQRNEKRLALGRGEQLEKREMLSGHGLMAGLQFSQGLQHAAQFAPAAIHAQAVASSAIGASFLAGKAAANHSTLTATLTDAAGGTGSANIIYQTVNLFGLQQSVIIVKGDTTAAGTSVALKLNGVDIGSIAVDSKGNGSLIVSTSNLGTTVAEGSTVSLGALSGALAAPATTKPTPEDHIGFTALLTDPAGGTAKATVTYQIGKLLGVSQSVISVKGDASAAGTVVPVTINGVALGTITLNSSGAGALTVPTSAVTTPVAKNSTVSIGALTGAFVAATPGDDHGRPHEEVNLSAALTDPAGGTATATVTYRLGRLLGEKEAVIKVTGDTAAAGTSVQVIIAGTTLGSVTLNTNGAGTLIVAASTVTTPVASGNTVSVGTLTGTFAATAPTLPPDGGHGGPGHSDDSDDDDSDGGFFPPGGGPFGHPGGHR